jgi:PAS domain S-box-containing protein
LFGYGKEEVIGKTSIELGMFVHPADRQEAVRRLQKDKSVRDFELDVRLKSGEVRSVSLSTETMNIGAQNMMLTMIQDISLRKQAEDALRASEERYRAVVENALDAIVVTDPSQGGRVLSVNPAACRMFGYSEAEFLELDREAMLDTSDPRLAAFLEQRHHHGQITGQLTYQRKNGEPFPGEISSVFYQDKNGEHRAVAIIRDITGRKQAEEALRRSEERFAKAFHASPSAITISRLSDGLIFEVNEGWQTVLGHRPEEVLRRTTLELDIYVHPADRAEAIKRLRQGGSLRDFEIEVRHKSGEVRLVSMSAEQIEINGVECLLTIMQDITDRKQFEVALRKRESILTQAGEMAHLGAWDIEFQNQSDINANPLTWSDEVYRIFGYAPGEVQPSNELFFERVHPDDRGLVRESVAQAIARRQPYVIEHRVRRADGEERIVQEHAEVFFDESGNTLRMVGAVQDITERKRAEEALRESEERFRSLADSMPQLVWTALQDGTVDYYNSRAQEYWGIKQVMATVWEWAPVLHPEDLQATVSAWQHALGTGEIYQAEHRVRMVDGSYRWHLSRGMPVHDEKGRIMRWFGTATDIHDTKMAEEQAKIYAERLEHSNRELEQFAFMASHDLQEPLRKIEMFGDLLLDEVEGLNDQGRNYLKRMQNAAERMRAMVEGLLKLSRVTTQGQPFVRVNLSQVCSEVLSDLGEQIRRTNCKLDISTLPVLEGDPLQLRQLIQNLIGNALKYHLPEKPPEVKVYAKQLPGKVQIFVEDKGIGFAQQDAPRIFQPFERLVGRSQYEGSGMGLAICRRIVERHGGEITARSQPGAGTTLIVTLPVSQSENTRTDLRKDGSNAESGITPGR